MLHYHLDNRYPHRWPLGTVAKGYARTYMSCFKVVQYVDTNNPPQRPLATRVLATFTEFYRYIPQHDIAAGVGSPCRAIVQIN